MNQLKGIKSKIMSNWKTFQEYEGAVMLMELWNDIREQHPEYADDVPLNEILLNLI